MKNNKVVRNIFFNQTKSLMHFIAEAKLIEDNLNVPFL